MNVLVLSGTNHGFDKSAGVIGEFLATDGFDVVVENNRGILESLATANFDVCVFGTGFTRTEAQPQGPPRRVPDLSKAQANGLFNFVSGGGGLAGIHGTAWWIGGQAVDLIGGHANWHPPGLVFEVHIQDTAHPITQGVSNFLVEDEIYMSAWDPSIHILASASWSGQDHPLAWTKAYGAGRVFYTTLGHGPETFAVSDMQRLVIQGVRWVGMS